MNYTPALHFDINYDHRNSNDDITDINTTTHTLGVYEEIFRENNFDYERDIFHETRCTLLKIVNDNRIAKNTTYEVTRKNEPSPKEYIDKLASDYMKIDSDAESTTCIEDVIHDFSGMDSSALSYIEFLLNELISERNNNND